MYSYFNKTHSKQRRTLRQGYSTRHSLLFMVEKFRKGLDYSSVSGMLLTDLSKAFDCLRHDLLIAKVTAYGFDQTSLCFTSQKEHRGLK